jgi:hypothetical protein
MNMISTGAFQTETHASDRQDTLAEKFAAVWEKKNAKTARAGGVSLMALSLAACGSDSTTTSTSTSTTTTTTTTTVTPVAAVFTTSIDTLTGTTGADTFKGDSATVSGADSAAGGAGADTLQVFGVAANSLPVMTGIENLELHNVEPGNVDLTGTAYADVTKLTLDGFVASAETITVEADDTLALKDVTGAGDVNIDAAATITALALEANGNVGISTDLIELDIGGTGIAAITLAMTGANYVDLDTAGATAAVKLTVTGDGTGTLDVDDDQTTIDASAATGGLTIQGDFAGNVTIKGTTGDDTITAAAELSAKDSIDGGAGTDTLSVTADFTAATGTISNIEIVELADTVNSQTIDADDAFAGVTKFAISGNDTSAAGVYTINDVSTGVEVTLKNVDPDATEDDDVVIDFKTDGTADTAIINVGSATVGVSMDALTADDPETVTMNLGSKDSHDIDDVNFTDATSVTVTGSGNATLTNINLKDATNTFDASAATGNLTLSFSDAQTQTIKTGSGKDSISISDAGISAYDVFDMGDGADTLTITDVAAAVTATLNAQNTETLIFETAASGSINMDLSKATSVSTIVIDDAGSAETFTFNFVPSGTTVQFLDIDDTGSDTHTVTGVTGAAEVTIDVDAVNGTNDETIDINNFTTVNFNQKTNALSGTSAASALADVDTGAATTLNISAADNTLTIADLSTAALTSLSVTGSTDVSISAGGATTIKTITASGLDAANNAAELVLGTGAAVFARATDAVITGSDGADTISMSVAAGTHSSNVIDAGDTATVSASVTGDLLSLGGTMTGDTVIDLSSTTDQISSISGVANAAAQKGFESVDGSSAAMVGTVKFTITGSTGINHITGDSGADVISAGDGADIITGKGGADVLTGGAGRDNFVFEATPTANGIDTIADFIEGAAGDYLAIGALDATFTGTLAVGTLAANGSTFASLAGSAASADVDVLILLDTTGFANIGAAEDEYCATLAAVTDNDGMIVIYFDSATSTVKAAFDADEAADSSGGVTVIAEFTSLGSADLTTFTADNFVIT